ncbi:MAG: hypothetical protein ACE5IR_00560 [bacterium]
MRTQLLIATVIMGLFYSGCVKRIPAYDEARKPISEREIKHYKKSTNTMLYALGGGSLSFGAGFFIGTLVDRAIDEDSNSAALWGTAATGAIIGTVLFARQGSIKDRNEAIEEIKEKRKKAAAEKLTKVKTKRQQILDERKRVEAIRKKQEAEKKKLEDKIKKKKKKSY